MGPGLGYSNTYPQQLKGLLGSTWSVANSAAGGAATTYLLETEKAILARRVPTRTHDVVAILIGTNDFLLDSRSPAAAYARVATIAADVIAASAEPVVLTPPAYDFTFWAPMVTYGDQASWETYCDLIRDDAGLVGYTVADVAASLGWPMDPANYISSIHLSVAGTAIMAGVVATAIGTL